MWYRLEENIESLVYPLQRKEGESPSTHKEVDDLPKIVCSASYVDTRSRANTTMGLDFEHMIKARAHKGG
jgi:hypothetical protein